jgi:glycosyltransferase involved in cell wall biosynthesis
MRADHDERLRVLMLVNRLRDGGGGAERFLVGLATYLPRDRYDVVVCTTRRSYGPLLQSLLDAGIERVALDRRHRLDVLQFARLVSLLRTRRFHVLHAHMFGSNVWGTLFGRLTGVPAVIAHEQTWSYEGKLVRRTLDGQFVGRFADAFVAVSERDAHRMVALEHVPREKIVVIPNAYIPRPKSEGRDWRQELGIPSDAPVVGTVAVMRPQKALDVLLDAFAQLQTNHPQAVLVMGGDGPCRAQLERRAAALGIHAAVRFPGYVQDLGGVLDACDVATMSSDFEGTPLFAIECMAHGVPLVCTDVGGIGEVLEPGRSVILVPPRDAAALARGIERLLCDPSQRLAQAEAAARQLPRYHISAVAQEFADLYERLAARRGAPSAR